MRRNPFALFLLLVLVVPARAQSSHAAAKHVVDADTLSDDEAEEGRPGMQYGVASGMLQYGSGRSEQIVSATARWVPVRWFSVAATPAVGHTNVAATGSAGAYSRGGLEDLPVEATIAHGFGGHYKPTLSGGLEVTLPTGDSAAGFGAGRMGSSASAALGLDPTPGIWVHLGIGRSLGGDAVHSAFTSASMWGDVCGGTELTDRLGVSGGFSSDLGGVDPAVGRSTSIESGLSYSVAGPSTMNVSLSRGLGGGAPRWSIALGFGTAFPYLNHLGSGGSALKALNSAFGAGTHGSSGSTPGSGRGHP
jgi:hypothetical protein